jgi:uncharacterized protein (DUF1015 family)
MNIVPFRAFRPVSSEAARLVSCPPYDVISTEEARTLSGGREQSFLNVIRPEITFPEGQNLYADEVYDAGRAHLDRLLASGHFTRDEAASVYVYRLTMQGVSSTGVFTCVRVADYDSGSIHKHELTRPDKEDDRTRHILAQQAHAEPVMLVHQKSEALSALLEAAVTAEPLLDIVTDDSVGHSIWRVPDTDAVAFLRAYEAIPQFYVADGHHRCAAASRAFAAGVNAGAGSSAPAGMAGEGVGAGADTLAGKVGEAGGAGADALAGKAGEAADSSRAEVNAGEVETSSGKDAGRAEPDASDQIPASDLAGTPAVFPAVLFPDGQMSIMAYNRVVFECSDEDLARMWSAFEVVATGEKNPSVKGDVAVYTRDGWKTIRLREVAANGSPVEKLDAGRLQTQLLGPFLGIDDPRTSSNIAFIGGIRGTDELERYVDSGRARIAFSMYPTSVQELMDVSDAGLLMPPKSTWFEPKLRSGLLVHTFGR